MQHGVQGGLMDEIAIGRKEIMKALHVECWRTVIRRRKKDEGFRRLFRVDPISKKPMIIVKEYVRYVMLFNKLQK
jgi:hypothetical protein